MIPVCLTRLVSSNVSTGMVGYFRAVTLDGRGRNVSSVQQKFISAVGGGMDQDVPG